MVRRGGRTSPCSRDDATARLRQADAFIMVAELVLADENEAATPGVAAAMAVLAGIAASDVACCAKLKRRARGQAHDEAVALLATVEPHGRQMAKDLQRLLDRKDDAHYGLRLVSMTEATRLVGYAKRMVEKARRVLVS